MRITVRLTPKGGRDAIEGWMTFGDQRMLKARVSSPRQDGKANAALIALLAKTFDLPRSKIRIASGETARIKILEIDGDAALANRLKAMGEAK